MWRKWPFLKSWWEKGRREGRVGRDSINVRSGVLTCVTDELEWGIGTDIGCLITD